MRGWEYCIVYVDCGSIEYHQGYDREPGGQEWAPFLAKQHPEGWVLVPNGHQDEDNYAEYIFKRPLEGRDAAASEPAEASPEQLVVRLELATSCAGAYWCPWTANGQRVKDGVTLDIVDYFPELGRQGWELLEVRDVAGPGAYYPETAPREALFKKDRTAPR